MSTAQQCRLLAAKARVKARTVPAESDAYLAIAREYEAIAAAMEAKEGNAAADIDRPAMPLSGPARRPAG